MLKNFKKYTLNRKFIFDVWLYLYFSDFSIDNSGVIFTKKIFDYEAIQQESMYYISLNVTDGDHIVSTVVRVEIGNVNDNDPVFVNDTYIVELKENATAGNLIQVITSFNKFVFKQFVLQCTYASICNTGICVGNITTSTFNLYIYIYLCVYSLRDSIENIL